MERPALRWLFVAVYVNAVFWSIPYVRPASNALRQAGARWVFGAAGIVFAAAVIGMALRRAHWTGLAAATVVYAALVAYLRGIPDEVVHLAEYGGLGLLVRFALDTSPGAAKSAVAIVLTAALGFLDEWTQGATPGRFFDWRDVAVNTVAAAVPVLLLAAKKEERQ